MSSPFDKLTSPGKVLKVEPPDRRKFEGLSAPHARLRDAQNTSLSIESRFDLAYNAAHSLCLAALRWHGYRPGHRYIVFQLLPLTLGLGPDVWRVLDKCHGIRNLGEYEGDQNIDDRIVTDLIASAHAVAEKVDGLAAIE